MFTNDCYIFPKLLIFVTDRKESVDILFMVSADKEVIQYILGEKCLILGKNTQSLELGE